MIEARLRQERSFLLTSPLTLFGDRASFQWQGELFSIQGEEEFAISIVSVSESHLLPELLESLTVAQGERIQGHGIHPSIRDAAPLYRTHPIYRNLFNVGFWNHLLHQLPAFADTLEGKFAACVQVGHPDASSDLRAIQQSQLSASKVQQQTLDSGLSAQHQISSGNQDA